MTFKRWAPVGGIGTSLIFLFVWQQIQSVRLGYQLERLHKQIATQRANNAYLRLEVERRLSPEEIARAARERLQMIPPSPESIVVLQRQSPPAAMTAHAFPGIARWCAALFGLGRPSGPAEEPARPATKDRISSLPADASSNGRWVLAAMPTEGNAGTAAQ